jgi:release factor glutamine methyltransferase
MITIDAALQRAAAQLISISDIANLEAEILLAETLRISRAHLYAWPKHFLTETEEVIFKNYVDRRVLGEPIAYITGHREFWSLDFLLTSATLIPRAETEIVVQCVLATFNDDAVRTIADLGTGAGVIALALAKEKPQWKIHATERMSETVDVAKLNAQRLSLAVDFHLGDWCAALPKIKFDAIVSNPPYIAKNDLRIDPYVKQFEPHSALFSREDGLYDMRRIIQDAKKYLKPGGYVFLEHGSSQASEVAKLLEQAGYKNISLFQDMAGLDRVTLGYIA